MRSYFCLLSRSLSLSLLFSFSAISSLDLTPAGDNERTYLMGGGIFDTIADLICICDEDWLHDGSELGDSSTSEDHNGEPYPVDSDHKTALELCSRALNTLGSLCTFKPFLAAILEDDLCDGPLEDDIVLLLASHINNVPATSSSSSSSSTSPFQLHTFRRGLQVLHFPLLCAVLFWSTTARYTSCRSQALFALSWMLTENEITRLLLPCGLVEILFRLLNEQVERVRQHTDPTSGGSERVSVTQENIRLYTCICLQRLSHANWNLFRNEPLEKVEERLEIIMDLLDYVHSYNIRALLLNILLKALTPSLPNSSFGPNSNSSTTPLRDLPVTLNVDIIHRLREFRSSCATIGSSHSSRRTSPAFGAMATARNMTVPPMTSTMFSRPITTTTIATTAPSATSSATSTDPTAAAATSAEDAEDAYEPVGDLLRDPEQGIDKTAHLQQLVDAIIEKATSVGDETKEKPKNGNQ